MHYGLIYSKSGAFLLRKDNFLVRPPDFRRGISWLVEGTSSERQSIFAAGFGETYRTSFDRSRYPLDETPRVLRFTEVTRALTDFLLLSMVG